MNVGGEEKNTQLQLTEWTAAIGEKTVTIVPSKQQEQAFKTNTLASQIFGRSTTQIVVRGTLHTISSKQLLGFAKTAWGSDFETTFTSRKAQLQAAKEMVNFVVQGKTATKPQIQTLVLLKQLAKEVHKEARQAIQAQHIRNISLNTLQESLRTLHETREKQLHTAAQVTGVLSDYSTGLDLSGAIWQSIDACALGAVLALPRFIADLNHLIQTRSRIPHVKEQLKHTEDSLQELEKQINDPKTQEKTRLAKQVITLTQERDKLQKTLAKAQGKFLKKIQMANDLFHTGQGIVQTVNNALLASEGISPLVLANMSYASNALGCVLGALSIVYGGVQTVQASRELIHIHSKLKALQNQAPPSTPLPPNIANTPSVQQCEALKQAKTAQQKRLLTLQQKKQLVKVISGTLMTIAGALAVAGSIAAIIATGGIALFPLLLGLAIAGVVIGVGGSTTVAILQKRMKSLLEKAEEKGAENLPAGIKHREDLVTIAENLMNDIPDKKTRDDYLKSLGIENAHTTSDIMKALMQQFDILFPKGAKEDLRRRFEIEGISLKNAAEAAQSIEGKFNDPLARALFLQTCGLGKTNMQECLKLAKDRTKLEELLKKDFAFLFQNP